MAQSGRSTKRKRDQSEAVGCWCHDRSVAPLVVLSDSESDTGHRAARIRRPLRGTGNAVQRKAPGRTTVTPAPWLVKTSPAPTIRRNVLVLLSLPLASNLLVPRRRVRNELVLPCDHTNMDSPARSARPGGGTGAATDTISVRLWDSRHREGACQTHRKMHAKCPEKVSEQIKSFLCSDDCVPHRMPSCIAVPQQNDGMCRPQDKRRRLCTNGGNLLPV